MFEKEKLCDCNILKLTKIEGANPISMKTYLQIINVQIFKTILLLQIICQTFKMSLIEKLESVDKLDFFNATLTPGEIDGKQLLSSTTDAGEENMISMGSLCKLYFKTEEEYERHIATDHKNLQKDDKRH